MTKAKKKAATKSSPAPEAPEKATAQKAKKKFKINVYEAWCKKCGICVAFCPVEALRQDEASGQVISDDAKCIGCRLCEMRCPDFSITVLSDGSPEVSNDDDSKSSSDD